MAETPRTQVEEPRFGVSIQPAADPVDRTIIARAPSITPDPYMNAWSEIARDFASAYGGIKKAQVEADIPMGEQYYLESGIDGLFEDGKDQLVAMAKLTQNQQVAEEHSVGTRIGFERAAGRSAANRERSKITAVLTDMLAGSGGLDEYGLPKMPTGQDIEQAVAKVRAENYSVFKNKPEYAWFYNSPYATEEYNKVIRSVVPEITESFKQKAREQMTENKRAMVAESLTNKIVAGFEEIQALRASGASAAIIEARTAQLYAGIGDDVTKDVVAAAIPNVRQFVAQTFKTAGIVLLDKNPQANGNKLAADFNRFMNGYSFKGKSIAGLYGLKAADDISTEGRQRETQRVTMRQNEIKSRVLADQEKYETDKTTLSYRLNDSLKKLEAERSATRPTNGGPPPTRAETILRIREEWIKEATSGANKVDPAFAIDVADAIVGPYLETEALGIKRDNEFDRQATERSLAIMMSPGDRSLNPDDGVDSYTRALQYAEDNIRVPSNKLEAKSMLKRLQDSKVPEMLRKDPVLNAAMNRFKQTAKLSGVVETKEAFISMFPNLKSAMSAQLGERIKTDTRIVVRPSISNKKIDIQYQQEWEFDNINLIKKLTDIETGATKGEGGKPLSIAERRQMMEKTIHDATLNRAEDLIVLSAKQTKLENDISSNETLMIDNTALIMEAAALGVIDDASRNRLLSENDTYMRAAVPTKDEVKSAVTAAYITAAAKAAGKSAITEHPYWKSRLTLVSPTTGTEAPKFNPSSEGMVEINLIVDEILADIRANFSPGGGREDVRNRYTVGAQFNGPVSAPGIIKSSFGKISVRTGISNMANFIIDKRAKAETSSSTGTWTAATSRPASEGNK